MCVCVCSKVGGFGAIAMPALAKSSLDFDDFDDLTNFTKLGWHIAKRKELN